MMIASATQLDPSRRYLSYIAAAILGLVANAGPALAQGSGCTITTLTDPPRDVLHCRDGLDITAESATTYTLVDNSRLGRPIAAKLESKALLVDFKPRRPGEFQIRTPYAIASVRGTTWAVDTSPERTSVFVQTGTVEVTRVGSSEHVTLRSGDGVDVAPGTEPLRVTRWPALRVATLLARFGR